MFRRRCRLIAFFVRTKVLVAATCRMFEWTDAESNSEPKSDQDHPSFCIVGRTHSKPPWIVVEKDQQKINTKPARRQPSLTA
jgi:hypothetical protein